MNYDYNKKYFVDDDGSCGGVLIVIILTISGLSILSGGLKSPDIADKIAGIVMGLVLASIGFIGLGAIFIRRDPPKKPSDNELDKICLAQIKDLKQKALRKLGIDEEEVKLISPVVIHGYSFTRITTPIMHKTGKDNINRSSNYEAMILLFSENQVHTYKYTFSIIADEHSEDAEEYFYQDIVTISTSSERETIKTGKAEKTIQYEAFKLTTAGGNSLVCALRDVGGTEKSIQGMRQLLRQKKTAYRVSDQA